MDNLETKMKLIVSRLQYWCLLLSIVILTTSGCQLNPCSSKNSFVNHLSKTVEKVRNQSDSWTEEEWKAKDAELEKLMDECYEKYKDELTREERKQVFKDATSYVYLRSRDKMDEVFDMIKDIDIDKEADRMLNIADDQVKEIFNEVLADKEVSKFIDSAVEELNKVAKDLKEAWEEAKAKEK